MNTANMDAMNIDATNEFERPAVFGFLPRGEGSAADKQFSIEPEQRRRP
jgi:hypothetical protein